MWIETGSKYIGAASDNDQSAPRRNRTRFPAGTVARIFRRARSPMSSGRADTRCWRLTFNSRVNNQYRRFIDPLMGWTGSTDPLSALELRFPTLESAIRYAGRQALDFVIEGAPAPAAPALRDQKPAPAVLGKQAA
jgi:hypothetical protein